MDKEIDFDIIGEMNAPQTINSELFIKLQKEFSLDNIFDFITNENENLLFFLKQEMDTK